MSINWRHADRSDYDYWIDNGSTPLVLVIEDLNGEGMSVTNNIENILACIARLQGLGDGTKITGVFDNIPIVYKDSDGFWDGVTITDNESVQFYCLNSDTLPEALHAARTRKERNDGNKF